MDGVASHLGEVAMLLVKLMASYKPLLTRTGFWPYLRWLPSYLSLIMLDTVFKMFVEFVGQKVGPCINILKRRQDVGI